MSTASISNDKVDITKTYLNYLESDPEMTMPIAAIESLIHFIKLKDPKTSAEMIESIKLAIDELTTSVPNSISLKAGCDIFMRFILKNINLFNDWEDCKKHLIENGQLFILRAKKSREKIASFGIKFITDDDIILIHGYSRAVLNLLSYAAKNLIRFRCIVTESRPTNQGKKMYSMLNSLNIPTILIIDNQVGSIIHKINKVFVGAEGVAESGGVINLIGTYSIGVLAKNSSKPFYVISESHKFVRMFPLSSDDVPGMKDSLDFFNETSIHNSHDNQNEDDKMIADLSSCARVDYTSQEYITALITDLGVLTPSAVSEELIKMWYD